MRCLAELLGTAVLVALGTGAVVAATIARATAPGPLAVAWFAAVTVPVVLVAPVSGAHLNPAVTLALALGRTFDRREVLPYVGSQVAGALLGSVAVGFLLGPEGHLGATIPIAGTLPVDFAVEAMFTGLLVLSVLRLARRGFGRYRWRLLLPGLVVGAATYLIGPLTGCSLNPARTLAPALLSGTTTDLWLYLLAVPLGAILVVPLARAWWGSLSPEESDPGSPGER